MEATISKDFTFSASHQLDGLPDDHPCTRLHGHNYTVRLTITGHTDTRGFIIDYRDLGWFKNHLDDVYDHRHLNDLIITTNPTAENIAHHLLDHFMITAPERLAGALDHVTSVSVSVSETPKTWATATTHRPCDLPRMHDDRHRERDRWLSVTMDPHDHDNDRYRWDFTNDGTGK